MILRYFALIKYFISFFPCSDDDDDDDLDWSNDILTTCEGLVNPVLYSPNKIHWFLEEEDVAISGSFVYSTRILWTQVSSIATVSEEEEVILVEDVDGFGLLLLVRKKIKIRKKIKMQIRKLYLYINIYWYIYVYLWDNAYDTLHIDLAYYINQSQFYSYGNTKR